MAWTDFFKLWSYSRQDPIKKRQAMTAGTGATRPMLSALAESSKCKTVLFVEVDTIEEAERCVKRELMFAFDYVICRNGVVVKNRKGQPPPVIPTPTENIPPTKGKYRSIDDV